MLFYAPNSFTRFNFRAYLNLSASAEFTVSDRVHACAASLAYGKPARLIEAKQKMISMRSGIFDRVGAYIEPETGILYPPETDLINTELINLKNYLKEKIG